MTLLKAIRNEQEIAGIHHAMQRDGVALVKFLKWLEASVLSGKETELSVDRKLHEFRAAQPLYMGESFDTIAGYKEHGSYTIPQRRRVMSRFSLKVSCC